MKLDARAHASLRRTIAPRRRAALLLVAAVALVSFALPLATTALAGPVRGRVALPEATEPEALEDAFYWNAWNGFLAAREATVDPRREMAVVLRGTSSGEPEGCRYAIQGGDLSPKTMVAPAGGTIRIENQDGTAHELSIDGLEGGAPLATAPGNARPVTVPAGGPYAVTDALYGHVHGTIVPIDDLVACGTFAADGAFEFPSVPAGNYRLSIYRGGEEVHGQDVLINEGATEIERISLR